MVRRWQNLIRTAAGPAVAVVLFSGSNLLAYRHFAGQGDGEVVFHFVNAQLAANALVVFFLYGLNFEARERRPMDVRVPALLSALLGLFVPVAGLAALYTLRQGLLKFGRRSAASSVLAAFALLTVAGLAAWWRGMDAAFVVIATIAVALPFLAGESSVELPDFRALAPAHWRAGLVRTTLDLSLLLPPLAVNMITKRYLPDVEYVQLQTVFYSLFAMAVITSIGERIIFHHARREQVEKEARHWKWLLLLAAYAGVGVLGWFLRVPWSLSWYLVPAPAIAWGLAVLLAEARAHLTAAQCLRLGLVWTAAGLLLGLFLVGLALTGSLTAQIVLGATLALSGVQVVTLKAGGVRARGTKARGTN